MLSWINLSLMNSSRKFQHSFAVGIVELNFGTRPSLLKSGNDSNQPLPPCLSKSVEKQSVFDVFGDDEELQDAVPFAPGSNFDVLDTTDRDAARKLLDAWLDIHQDDPYLKPGDAEALAHLTRLTAQQVRTYMNNARSRKLSKADSAVSRNASATSVNSFGSSSSWAPRRGRRRYRTSSSLSLAASSSKLASSKEKIYQCTWCGDGFVRKSDWKRHEQSTHLPQEEWVCMPSYPIRSDEEGLAVCEFCGIKFEKKDDLNDGMAAEKFDCSSFFVPEPNTLILDHLQEQHNYQPCFSKLVGERTFTRKDKLQQHLMQVHGLHTMSKFMVTDWKFQVNQNLRFICGFCGCCLDSWDERAHHVASHFETGKDLSSWQPWPNEPWPNGGGDYLVELSSHH